MKPRRERIRKPYTLYSPKNVEGYTCDRCGRPRPIETLKRFKQQGLLLCEKCHDSEVIRG